MIEKIHKDIQTNLRKYNHELVDMKPQRMLTWGYEKFDKQFAITTSFGIQSSVLLDMVSKLSLQKKIKIFWIDTGYLHPETYHYAEKLIEDLSLEVKVLQSELSPARMEAKYGKLWETNKEIFYYMEENHLPAHPLFIKGYSSVGDWHSSSPDGIETKGRNTRFGGIKQECGIHIND